MISEYSASADLFRELNQRDWVRIFQHLKSHEVIGIRPMGRSAHLLRERDPQYVLEEALAAYFEENNATLHDEEMGRKSLIPDSERELAERAGEFVRKVEDSGNGVYIV